MAAIGGAGQLGAAQQGGFALHARGGQQQQRRGSRKRPDSTSSSNHRRTLSEGGGANGDNHESHFMQPTMASSARNATNLLSVSGRDTPHNNKLRIGHLKGNRFKVRLVELDADAPARLPALLERLAAALARRSTFRARFVTPSHVQLVALWYREQGLDLDAAPVLRPARRSSCPS